ncbi:MAG: flagellar hook-length control protein FliK, partial [Amphiplicatus sp.]
MDFLKALGAGGAAPREIDGAGDRRATGDKTGGERAGGANQSEFASRVIELQKERANRKDAALEKPARPEKTKSRESGLEGGIIQAGVRETAAPEAPSVAGLTLSPDEAVDGLVNGESESSHENADFSLPVAAAAEMIVPAPEAGAVSAEDGTIHLLAQDAAASVTEKSIHVNAEIEQPSAAPNSVALKGDASQTGDELAKASSPAIEARLAAAVADAGEAPVDEAGAARVASGEAKPALDAAGQPALTAPKAAAGVLDLSVTKPADVAESPLEEMETAKAAPESMIGAEGRQAAAGAPKMEALTVSQGGVKLALDAQAAPVFASERPLQAEAGLQMDPTKPHAALAQTRFDAPEAARQIFASIRTDKGGGVDLRLDPPDLGKVRIQFSFERSDVVVATVSSERGETLDLMRRHSADLARELQRAGFESVTLEFASGESKGSPLREAAHVSRDFELGDDIIDAPSIVYVSARADNRLDRLV